jgi:hypothetical protein
MRIVFGFSKLVPGGQVNVIETPDNGNRNYWNT